MPWQQRERILKNDLYEIILKANIFRSFDRATISKVLKCLNARIFNCDKNINIYPIGKKVKSAALIIEGEVDISLINNAGNKVLLCRKIKHQLVAAAMASNNSINENLDIRSNTRLKIIFLELPKLDCNNKNTCPFKTQILQNLVQILAENDEYLSNKVLLISEKLLRDKLLLQLSTLSKIQKNNNICIPYTREELAQLICAERSSVSRELCRMKKEGLINIEKNCITLNYSY